MIRRVVTIALSTYREAVRARLLVALFVLGLFTCAYGATVATLSLHDEERVIADFGAASVSIHGVAVAIVLGSTSLYLDLERRAILPILSRPIRRWEYLLGKYLGSLVTVAVFMAGQAALVFALLAIEAGRSPGEVALVAAGWLAASAGVSVWARGARVFAFVPCAAAALALGWALAAPAFDERRLVTASVVLSFSEVGIVAAVAALFASFSSPFLTGVCTAIVFALGRSAETLAHLPPEPFGPAAALGRGLARVVPNLHVYVPARSLLLGGVSGEPPWPYVAAAVLNAVAYAAVLLVLGSLAFRNRDFS